jgi:carboxyl-terminal processing protease
MVPINSLLRLLSLLVLLTGALISAEAPVAFPDMAPTVGAALERDYYDAMRFQPKLMVERALRQLKLAEPSILTTWSEGVIALTVGSTVTRLPAPDPTSLDAAMMLIETLRVIVDGSGFKPAKARDLDYSLINGALTCLDPHTVLMAPEPAKEFQEEIAGEFFGIGAFLGQEEGINLIRHAIPGLPADRAGIEDGDIILGVDGEKTAGLSLEQVTHRIRGPKGTQVVLTIERKTADKALEVPITRDLVQVITMQKYRSGDIGYVRMDEFSGYTARDLLRSIAELQKAGPMKAFILDLRFNGGGLLDQAKLISDFFLAKGQEIVRTVTVDGQPRIFKSSDRKILDIPIVVLTSSGSASAAEILSGALQCNDRALVAGTTSFGKGSVQTVKGLPDGSRLKLTIQEYQLPGGVSIQDVGINPDLRLIQHTQREDGHIDMIPFTGMREVDEEFALTNKHQYAHPGSLQLGWLAKHLSKDELKRSSIASPDFVPDQEAALVIDLLVQAASAPTYATDAASAALAGTTRQFLIKALHDPVTARAEVESVHLAAALAARTPMITWGPDATAPAGAFTLHYTGPATIAAGADAQLTFSVDNAAATPVGRLYGVIKADKFSPLWEDEVIFGTVDAQKTCTGIMTFHVPPRLYAGEERFQLELFHDGDPAPLTSIPVRLGITPQPRPHFSYSWELTTTHGDGTLAIDEQEALKLTLRNDGEGRTAKVDLRVYKDNDPYVQLGDNHIKLDPLDQGQSASFTVPVKLLKAIKRADTQVPFTGSAIKLQVRAEELFDEPIDGRFRATLFHTLVIPVNTAVDAHAIVPPRLAITGIEPAGENQVKIAITVAGEHLRFLSLFQEDEKVDLQPASKLGPGGLYTAVIALKPGVNAVRLLATNQDEMSEFLPLRLWGEGTATTVVGK